MANIKTIKVGNTNHDIDAKYWGSYETTALKTINGESIISTGGGNINTNIEEVTYSYLKATLRDRSKLLPGKQYRITDYITIVKENINKTQKSANNQFDIIVTAASENTLNDVARVCLHNGDTYFENSKLDAWEIKYCLDNDTDRFTWADTTNGKGVIYYMKDEFGNEAPYDFKNIQFKRENDTAYYYTFDYTTNGKKYDGSVKYGQYCYNNKIEVYRYTDGKYYLPANIMKNTSATSKCCCNIFKLNAILNTLGNGCYNNIFGVGSWNNTFGNGCHDNTFGNDCHTNVFGNSCSNNTFANDCHTNEFGNSCSNNIFANDCKNNKFGESCQMNTFDQLCESNKFGKICAKNTFGLYCKNNIFGESVSLVKFGEQCSENVLGNNNMLITFGLYCKKNIISSTKPDDNIVGSNGNITNRNEYNPTETKYSENAKGYIRYFTFGDSVQENIFWSNASTGVQENGSVKYLQMYNVDSYIIGKAIELTGSDLQSYMTNINRNSSGNIQQYVEGDFVSKIDGIESSIDEINNNVVVKSELNAAIEKVTPLISITYSGLVGLRETSSLISGVKYRITDYKTTTIESNTQSVNNKFDIIVEAFSTNKLSEDAKVCLHNGDTYFENSKLDAWEIKYCLDNDTSRFAWADKTNGKGVIYYMKDEFGNEAPYDFKNIKFIYNTEWLAENTEWKKNVLGQYTGTNISFYTFSYYNTQIGVIDDSLKVYSTPKHYSHGNKINNYFSNENGKLTLNNIVFVSTGNSPYNNIIDSGCHDCIFGNKCYENVIGFNASNNVIGSGFYKNTVGSGFINNKIYHSGGNPTFNNNILGNDCQDNIFPRQFISCECGYNFINNDFLTNNPNANTGSVSNCIFGNNFSNNTNIYYRLSNTEILNNSLSGNLESDNWDEIIANNGKSINKCLFDYSQLGNFKKFIGLNEAGKIFVNDFNTQGVYQMGHFLDFKSALQRAATVEIAGKESITKICFTTGVAIDNSPQASNKDIHTGYIEQYVYKNISTQVIIWQSGFRMRKITFTDINRTTIDDTVTTDSIKNGEGTGVYWSNPTSLYYDQASHKIALNRFDDGQKWGLSGCFGEVEIPLVNNSRAGLMSAGDKSLLTDTSALLNKFVKSKVYHSLPNYVGGDWHSHKRYWYRFAKINDKSPNIFRISTNAANDVIFTSSIGWSNGSSYDVTGALSVINSSLNSNLNHACIEGIRLVASPSGGYIDMLLNTPYANTNSNGYVEIYVTCISTIFNSNGYEPLYDEGDIIKLEEKGAAFERNGETIIQSFDLVDRAIMSKDFILTNENGEQISVADSILDLENKLSSIQNISYSDLKTLRDNGQLLPGNQYRITDYITIVKENTNKTQKSVNNQFDIIVTAASENTLNDVARVCLHNGDEYFKNSKLDAWEIKYCLDNDTDRFTWADKTNGKGVIYYMKDEFGNEAPYDFKNIQFKRENDTVYYYTFDYTTNGKKYDGSVNFGKYCYNNKIEVYKFADDGKYYLPANIMKNTSATSKCCCNIFKLNAIQNTLGNGCYNNIFGVGSWNNTFGNSCYDNTFGNDCHTNVFGNSCSNNTFDSDCKNNIFGESCQMNTFDQLCESNKFGKICTKNTFGLYCKNNIFGESVSLVKFEEQCSENVLGNNNMLITFGLYCKKNIISSTKPDNTIVDSNGNITNRNEYNPTETKYLKNAKGYIRYFTFGDSVQENIFWSDVSTGAQEYLQMYNVDSYIIGKAIELEYYKSKSYMTNINRDSGGNIHQYVEGDFVSTIDGITTDIDEITSDIDGIESTIDGIKTYIDGVKTDIGKIDGIESTIDGITTDIDGIKTDIVDVVVKSELNAEIEKVTSLISITYLELVGLRDSSSLILGVKYRITDYKTTTIEPNSKSVNNKFDIIVEALSTNKLSEDVKVCLHSNDDNDYFKNSKLDAWEIKYCLDNDTSRFAWADKTNGKGVIYYMKDEFGNEAPYDFKNIQFKRKNEDVYYYTFDYTINGEKYDGSVNFGKYCYNNKIEVYKFADDGKYYLPKNIMKNTTDKSKCCCNIFKLNAIQNTLGNSCYNNIFGVGSWNNTFGNGCYENTFGNDCYKNEFGNYCTYNNFGNHCRNIAFYKSSGEYNNIDGVFVYSGEKLNNIFNVTLDNECSNLLFYSESITSINNITVTKGVKEEGTNLLKIEIPVNSRNYELKIARNTSSAIKIYCEADLIR